MNASIVHKIEDIQQPQYTIYVLTKLPNTLNELKPKFIDFWHKGKLLQYNTIPIVVLTKFLLSYLYYSSTCNWNLEHKIKKKSICSLIHIHYIQVFGLGLFCAVYFYFILFLLFPILLYNIVHVDRFMYLNPLRYYIILCFILRLKFTFVILAENWPLYPYILVYSID